MLTDLDVAALVAFHDERGAEGTIALHPVDDPSRYGVVPTDDDGRVIAFVEKPPPGEAPTNLINAGTYVLEPSVLDRIPAGRRCRSSGRPSRRMVADGSAVRPRTATTYWIDTGTPADVPPGPARPARRACAAAAVAGRRTPTAAVDAGATVAPLGASGRARSVAAGAAVERLGAAARAPASAPAPWSSGSIVGARRRRSARGAQRRRTLACVGDGEVVAPGAACSTASRHCRVPEEAAA